MNLAIVLYTIMFLLVLAKAGAWKSRSARDLVQRLGFEKIRLKRELAIAVTFFGLLFLASVAVSLAASMSHMEEDMGKVTEALKGADLADLLSVVLVASFVEEVFFRGFLQRRIGILAATFIFAYFHIVYGSFFEIIGAFMLGLILGKEYQLTRNLFAPVLSHTLYNLVVVVATFA